MLKTQLVEALNSRSANAINSAVDSLNLSKAWLPSGALSGLTTEPLQQTNSFFQGSSSSTTSLVVPDPGSNLGTATNIGTLEGTQTLSDFVGDADASDIYRFKLNSNSNFNLVLDGLTADADAEIIQDFNNNRRIDTGEVIAFSDFGQTFAESINLSGLVSSTYYVRVNQFEGNTNYTLRLSNTAPSNLLFSDIEVGLLNDTQTFSDFVGSTDTSDLYSFTLDTVSDFNLVLDGLSADANVRLIQDSNNNGLVEDSEVIASSTAGSNLPESINLSGLAAGNYFTQIYQFSGDTNYNLQVSATATLAEIQGTKWNDQNGNGVQDVGEPGLAGWTIYLDQNLNGQLDVGETSTTTNANGDYALTDLQAGTYTVAEVLQPGWRQTSPSTVVNGGFETGNFTGWQTLGNTSIVGAGFGANPTEGTSQALLTNGFGSATDASLETFLELSTGTLDGLGNGNATEGSAIRLAPITIAAGTTLSFDWNFLTNEGTPSFFNDFAFISIGSLTELADTSSTFVLSPTIFNEETGYETFSYTFATTGEYVLGFGVVDVADSGVDSSLLIDNFSLNAVYEITLNPGQTVTDIDFGNQLTAIPGSNNGGTGQVVFLDFVSDQDVGEYVYTAAEQNAILQNVQEDYQAFDYSFSLTQPTSGNFSRLIFNADGISGGLAEDIDFRNLNNGDNAFININGILGSPDLPPLTSENVVALSSTIAAHELGHLSGLRHGDSYGPIGSGIHNPPGPNFYLPVYPGPVNADETTGHLMASPASVGQSIFEAVGDPFFGEREAVKLAFNENGTVVSEQTGDHSSITTAQAIALSELEVPNTLLSGDNVGKDFQVQALAVTGSLSTAGEADFYSFEGLAGQLFNFEVISSVLNRSANPIDSQIRIFDSSGNLVPYYTSVAFNNDEFESSDSTIIDLLLPENDTYFIQVNAFSPSDTGSYELFLHQFAAVDSGSSIYSELRWNTSSLIPSSNPSSVSSLPTQCFCQTCLGRSGTKVGTTGSSNLAEMIAT